MFRLPAHELHDGQKQMRDDKWRCFLMASGCMCKWRQ